MAAIEVDGYWMARALVLARRGRYTAHPNPCVGAVLVRDGRIIGEGWHRRAGEAHAEIVALRQAEDARGATCYVTLEPCAHQGRTGPCCEALVAAGVERVVVATTDPNPRVAGRGLAYLRSKGIAVELGVMQEEARQLNSGFFKRMQHGRPKVVLKLAATVDGGSALANGDSKWITGEAARYDVQRLRASCGAVVTGAGTVVADNPRLTVRGWPEGPKASELLQPLRVVLDPRGRVSSEANVFAGGHAVWVTQAPVEAPEGVIVVADCIKSGRVELQSLLDYLACQWEINQVLVEAGPKLAGAFLHANLVDELWLYQAAKLIGPEQQSMLTLPPLQRLAEAWTLPSPEIRRIGKDWRLRFVLTSHPT